MGSYDRFESDFFSKLYQLRPQHGFNYTLAYLSQSYDIPQREVRELLIDWWERKLIVLSNGGIRWEDWGQKSPNQDFFCYPPANPQFWVELTSRGEDRALKLHNRPIGFTPPCA